MFTGDRRAAPVLGSSVVASALFTASVHLYLALHGAVAGVVRVEFFLAAGGFVGSLLIRYVPVGPQRLARWLGRIGLLGTALGTIIGYFVVMGFVFTPIALAAKVDEVLLISLVLVDAAVGPRKSRAFGSGRTQRRPLPRAA